MADDNQDFLIEEISSRLGEIRGRLAEACRRSGRPVGEVTLVAVSKTHPPPCVDAAILAGQVDFGENRVQEMVEKAGLVRAGACWHLIGHLQSNKVRKALTVADWIHGVDRIEIARDLERVAGEEGRTVKIFLEVNVSGEATKFGFSPERVIREATEIFGMRHLDVAGLMTMAPLAAEAEASRKYFVRLRELRDQVGREAGVRLPGLSMGMSNDYEIAVEEGATHVRVGSAIFGTRC